MMVELQTRTLPADLFDVEEYIEEEDFEWEEKMRKVKRAHERYWDDEA